MNLKKTEVSKMSLTILTHPLLQHKLTILRDKSTGVKIFREIVSEMSALMCYEAMRDLPLKDVEVITPVAGAKSKSLEGKKLALVPILRAGLGMVDGILDLVPSAKVAHIGLYRDPDTLQPVEYYCKLPHDIVERDCFILDPMLATGGTAVAAADYLKEAHARTIKLLSILSAPPGVELMKSKHPDVEIITCAVDERLNEHGYIVPGLGDAGDRIFGTR
jgi:uracil phosphoribosyltransferase